MTEQDESVSRAAAKRMTALEAEFREFRKMVNLRMAIIFIAIAVAAAMAAPHLWEYAYELGHEPEPPTRPTIYLEEWE